MSAQADDRWGSSSRRFGEQFCPADAKRHNGDPMSDLGEFIRRQRQLHELTLRQLAEMSGISNPYLSQIERGLRAPSEKVVEALADNLQLSAEALYEHAGRARDGGAAPDASPVIEAIKADPRLTAKQRQALLTVYDAFAGGRRGG
jgi:transcriptional regulator with XRE-family HTH domain